MSNSTSAIFAITTDPFIVLTSNVFAVLGLRALYFLLADMADRFHLLAYGLALVLIFIGVKMLIVDFYKIPGTIRASFAFYNTKEEIDTFVKALDRAVNMLQ